MISNLKNYVRKDKEKVKGWLTWIDAEIISSLLMVRHIDLSIRNALEIGVHRGKSAILILHGPKVEKLVAVDLFENQAANIDHSGSGNLQEFKENLAKFEISNTKIRIVSKDSTLISVNEIKGADIESFDIIHIDGGHTRRVVLSDLNLAAKLISSHGIIVVDDFQRPDWPEVGSAVMEWVGQREDFAIFCIGFNKVFISNTDYVAKWQQVMSENEKLGYFLRKIYTIGDHKVPVFYHFVTTEWSIKKQVYEYVRLFHPNCFIALKKVLIRLRSLPFQPRNQ